MWIVLAGADDEGDVGDNGDAGNKDDAASDDANAGDYANDNNGGGCNAVDTATGDL